MFYMYRMAKTIEKDLTEKQKNDIKIRANKRVIFDDKINCYTINITDYIEKLFGKDIIKTARIIFSEGKDIKQKNSIEGYSYIISLCSDFNINYDRKSFEDENTYIEITFINSKKIGFWANKSKIIMEESEYN